MSRAFAWVSPEPDTPVRVEVRALARARHLRLSFRPERGFLLTCPAGTSRAAIAAALEQARPWLQRVWKRSRAEPTGELPRSLELAARAETWEVDYAAARNRLGDGRLAVAAHGDPRRALLGLRLLLRRLATQSFEPRAVALAQAHGLACARLTCGLQRSRWGSCSSRGHIRLNSALLFVAPPLVDHVLLHELAHTRHLDHGADFQRLLRTLDPEHDRHRRALADAWQGLPAWWWEGGRLPAA